jgi:hypothetical protein
MLGHKVGEFHGKITGRRVLAPDGNNAKLETSAEVNGKVLNVRARIITTFCSIVAADGSVYSESPLQSLTITEDGDRGLLRAFGAGRAGVGLKAAFRGALFYQDAKGKLAPLNGHAFVFELDQDDRDVKFHFWEWK